MKKKILCLLLAVIMILGMLPFSAAASETVYISASYDGQYLDGMAYAAADLADVAGISLEEYGLEYYIYDSDSDGVEDLTALHLVIYAHTQIMGLDWSDVNVSGDVGSIFFEAGLFGNADCNMNYYVNGEYPANDGWGITVDRYVLTAGDFIDFAIFSSWNFMADSGAGFHYFMDSSDAITHSYTATAGQALTVKLGKAWTATFGSGTDLNPEPSYDVYYGSSAFSGSEYVTTDKFGEASLTFDTAGTYYLWANGSKGIDMDPKNYVSSPAYAKVTVEEAACDHDWQDATCETPRTCSECGETEGEANPDAHSYVDGVCEYCSEPDPSIPTTYTVTLPTGTGYTAQAYGESASPVTEGGSYSFTVTIAEGYEAGESFAVKANGEALTAVEGVYTISSITADQTVTVAGVVEEAEEVVIVPTVVYTHGTDGSNWPKSSGYIKTLTIDGANVKKYTWSGNTCDVVLTSDTPANATITFTYTAGGSTGFVSATLNGAAISTSTGAALTLADGQGTAAIKAQFMSASWSGTKTFNLSVAESNNLPTLADPSNASASATVTAGTPYSLKLTGLFTDADPADTLSYNVSVNGGDAEAVTLDEDGYYSFSTNIAGTYQLVFTATDSKEDTSKDTYTVTLTVNNSSITYEGSVTVPDGVEAGFYLFGGYDASGSPIRGEALTAQKDGNTYTMAIPENVDTICFVTSDGCGQAVSIGADAPVTLRKALVGGADSFGNEVVVTVTLKDAEGHAVTGSGNTYVLVVGQTYSVATTPGNTTAYKADNSSVTVEDGSGTADLTALVGFNNLKTVITPTGATAQIFMIGNYYSYREVTCAGTSDNGNGTSTHYFPGALGTSPTANTAIYRVTYEDYIVKAGYTSSASVTVSYSASDLKSNARVDYSTSGDSNAGITEDSVLLNVNGQGFLSMNAGGSRTLKAYRAWEIIPVSYNNWIIEPDFHFNVVWESEDDVISLENKANPMTGGESWQTLTANKAGTAIIEVSYDAVSVSGGSGYNGVYGASDPARTGLVVVQVGGTAATVDFGIVSFASQGSRSYSSANARSWDAEFDTLYFTGSSGQLQLSPTSAETITEVAVSNNKGSSWTTLSAQEGVYTATIVSGNNIIRVTTESGVAYQVVRGDKVTVTLTEQSGDEDGLFEAGETIRVTLVGLHSPIPKMAGNYNPGYAGNTAAPSTHILTYSFDGASVVGPGSQYNWLTSANYVDITIPAEDTAASYTLSDGYIGLGVIGLTNFTGDGDSHRNIPDGGCSTRGSETTLHTRSILPEITISVTVAETPAAPEVENSTGETPAAAYEFSADGSTLNVQSEIACVVLVKAADGSYTKLAATVNAEGGYDFDMSQLPEGASITIAVKGDANGDGSVGIADAAQVKAAQLGNLSLNSAATLIADVSGDGSIGIADAAQVKAAQLGTLTLPW